MNNDQVIDFIGDIMSMEKFSTKRYGFVDIMRVDNNTFSIKSIDRESLITMMNSNPEISKLVKVDDFYGDE